MQSNQELDLSWNLVEKTGVNIFLTGRAGTGKTTFLRDLVKRTRKRCVVLAPTGIAAINAGGSTLHSFFQLPFGPFIPNSSVVDQRSFRFSKHKIRMIRSLDLVIIDEISMVRADLLDSVDSVLRRYRDRTRPFGGVQLLMIGDLQQLAPVAKAEEWELLRNYYDTQYFFSSHALRESGFVTVELQTVYRQSNAEFVQLLNAVRTNTADASVLMRLNGRYIPGFSPAEEDGYIRLTTHNAMADRFNEQKLRELKAESIVYEAEVKDEFPELAYPTAQKLELKAGAQVMFVKNDSSSSKRFFNGLLGRVTRIGADFVEVLPQNASEPITVSREIWNNTRYVLNKDTKNIEEEVIGTFSQIPLKLAWSITVHKSQGLTFEKAIIDVQYSFTHGQTYVALSRCRSLEGMVLSAPIPAHAIINDPEISAFTESIPAQVPTPSRLRELEREYFLSLVSELFDFRLIRYAFDAFLRVVDEHLFRQYPKALERLKQYREDYTVHVDQVASSFAIQYTNLIRQGFDYDSDTVLQERCMKGAAYFAGEMQKMRVFYDSLHIESSNKAVAERLQRYGDELYQHIRVKFCLLSFVAVKGFGRDSYLRQRALVAVEEDKSKTTQKRKNAKGRNKTLSLKSDRADAHAAYEAEKEMADSANSYVCEDLSEYEDAPDFTYEGLPY